jgi:hypothetical protein
VIPRKSLPVIPRKSLPVIPRKSLPVIPRKSLPVIPLTATGETTKSVQRDTFQTGRKFPLPTIDKLSPKSVFKAFN